MKTGYVSEMFVSFQGEGAQAGRRHLFIRMAGCNLRCRYCDTPDSLERVSRLSIHEPEGETSLIPNPVTSAELLRQAAFLASRAEAIDGTALTGGEPLLQADFLADVLSFPTLPRPVLLETSGVLPDRLRIVLTAVDSISMDLKIPSNTGEGAFWDVHREFLSLARGKAYVKVLVDRYTTAEDLAKAAEMLRTTAPETPVFIQPITDQAGRVDVDEQTLHHCFSILRRGVRDVRVLPQTHKMLGIR